MRARGSNHDILALMATETPEEELKPCPQCGLQTPESGLQSCAICGNLTCDYCAKVDFGRPFCSARCRDFFFWGDGEQDEKDY